jgi:hypothetical protein
MAETWLRRWLFRVSLMVAAGLCVLIAVAPWLGGDEGGGPTAKLLSLLGRDVTLRRTCLASAAGLAVTARIFFYSAGVPSRPTRRSRSDMTGA